MELMKFGNIKSAEGADVISLCLGHLTAHPPWCLGLCPGAGEAGSASIHRRERTARVAFEQF